MKAGIMRLAAVVLLLCVLCGCSAKKAFEKRTNGTSDGTGSDFAAFFRESETQTDSTTVAPSQTRVADLYAEYLLNGGYEEILYDDYDDPEIEYEAEAAMADINDDGSPELLLKITNKTFMGVRGYSSVTVLLGMRNGQVERLGFADYGGGSGGGDYLYFKYDTVAQKHVLEYEEYVRDGMFASTLQLYYFDVSRYDTADKEYGMAGDGFVRYKTVHTLRADSLYTEGVYADQAQEILRENDLSVLEDDFVTSYMYDDAYVSEAEFQEMRERFVEPVDPAYQMKPVTMDDPVPVD